MCRLSYTAPGGFFFWTRFHNLVVFDGENCACANCIAKQRYIRGNSFATEDLGILEYSSMTHWQSQVSLCSVCTKILTLYNYYLVSTVLLGKLGQYGIRGKELEWFDGGFCIGWEALTECFPVLHYLYRLGKSCNCCYNELASSKLVVYTLLLLNCSTVENDSYHYSEKVNH